MDTCGKCGGDGRKKKCGLVPTGDMVRDYHTGRPMVMMKFDAVDDGPCPACTGTGKEK